MTRQELENKTVNELREICKEKGLQTGVHARKFTKGELIDNILGTQKTEIQSPAKGKEDYIETIQIGVLVAFREPETNRLNTAKVVNKSTKSRKLKVQTQYGAEFTIPYESVAWVKTGSRWPRGIYNELKGIKDE